MKINLSSNNPLHHATPALVIGCCEDALGDLFASCDAQLDGSLQRLVANREFSGKLNGTRLIDTQGKLPAERLLLVGLGKQAGLDDQRFCQAAGTAVQALRGARVASFASALQLAGGGARLLETVCEGLLLGSYSFDQYKTKDLAERFLFEGMTLLLPQELSAGDAAARVARQM